MNNNIKNIEVIQSRKLDFSSVKGEYKQNDILKIEKSNHQIECYLFLNCDNYYVKMPFDSILVSQIKDYTWNTISDNNVIIGENEDKKTLEDITKLHSIKFNVVKGNIKDLM